MKTIKIGSSGHQVIGSSEGPAIRMSRSGLTPKTKHQSKIIWITGFLLVVSLSAKAQAPNVRVRLYSLHSEQRIKVTARTAELRWKTCEQCEATHAQHLDLTFSAAGVKINGSRSEKQVFVEGDYRIEPSEGLSLTVNFPLEIKAEGNTLKVFLTLPLED